MKPRNNPQNKVVVLPEDSAERKKWCIYSGALSPFPNAISLVARQSYLGNEKHCTDSSTIQWNREVSEDHHDCLLRHLLEEDYVAVAWRALALLETKTEEGYNPFAVREERSIEHSCPEWEKENHP